MIATKGVGIGLTNSKSLTEGLGGTIDLGSIVDVGTRVCIKIPVVPLKEQDNEENIQDNLESKSELLSILYKE